MYDDNEGYSTTRPRSDRAQSELSTNAPKGLPEQLSFDREDTHAPVKTATGWASEGGHDLTKIQPLIKHSGESVATFFNGLFTTMIALATLGTSITFSYVLSNSAQPPADGSRFDADSVQFFLSVSWLLFLLTLAFASLGSTLLTFFKKHWIRDWDGELGQHSQLSVQLYAMCVSGVMGGLILAAFILLCLVVVAYQPVVGWVSVGFTTFFGIVILFSVLNQAPWPWIKARNPAQHHGDKEQMA